MTNLGKGTAVIDLPALILAGGLGTRLRSVLPECPKVLAPVLGRPFLSFLLDQLETAGVREVVLCTGHRAELVLQSFGARYGEISLRYSVETQPLGTAGAIRQAIEQIKAERVLVLNGDSFTHTPLVDFHRWHLARESSFPGSLMLSWADDPSRFGTVALGPRRDPVIPGKAPGGLAGLDQQRRLLVPTFATRIHPEGSDDLAGRRGTSALDQAWVRRLHHPCSVPRHWHAGVVFGRGNHDEQDLAGMLAPTTFHAIRLTGDCSCLTGQTNVSW